jgi:hypothetical protein
MRHHYQGEGGGEEDREVYKCAIITDVSGLQVQLVYKVF